MSMKMKMKDGKRIREAMKLKGEEMVREEYSPLHYWRAKYREFEPKMAFNSKDFDSYDKWREKFKQKFIECLGRFPKNKLPLDTQIVEVMETNTYTRKKIIYTADQFSKIPAYLFIPKKVKLPVPAIICCHGHGRGKSDPSGIIEKGVDKDWIRQHNNDYAKQFVNHNYITLAPDLRCFGERADDPNKVYGCIEFEEEFQENQLYHWNHWCDINFLLGILLGYNLLTLHIFDIGRGVDLLQSLPEVQKDRIGCVGLSQGGATAMFSTAYDDRIKVAGISGYFNLWKVFPMVTGSMCGSQIVPGLLEFGDHPEVAGLICPRPLFLEFGVNDHMLPIDASRKAFKKVKEIYTVAGVADRLEVEEFNGGHEFHGKRIFDFFEKWL